MKNFIFTLKHDNGTVNVGIRAENLKAAQQQLMESEKCPLSAIQTWWIIPTVYSFETENNRVVIKKKGKLSAYWFGNLDDLEAIKRAVNSHKGLLEAAKHFKECRGLIDTCDDCHRANKAIAQAEEK